MERRKRIQIAAIVLLGAIILGFLFRANEQSQLYSKQRQVKAWGDRIIQTGEIGGRNCIFSTANDLERAIRMSHLKSGMQLTQDLSIERPKLGIPRSCIKSSRLRILKYSKLLEGAEGVWRCEENGMIGEFSLIIFDHEKPFVGKNLCTIAYFDADLGIAVGDATIYLGN